MACLTAGLSVQSSLEEGLVALALTAAWATSVLLGRRYAKSWVLETVALVACLIVLGPRSRGLFAVSVCAAAVLRPPWVALAWSSGLVVFAVILADRLPSTLNATPLLAAVFTSLPVALAFLFGRALRAATHA